MNTFVISLGGSIVAPNSVDVDFLKQFKSAIEQFLLNALDVRLVFVVGGGAPAREYQKSLKSIDGNVDVKYLDWVGIRATHLNAEVVRCLFNVEDDVVVNPKADDIKFTGRILVAGGWKPGFSTDTDSVYLATRFGAKTALNLSNTKGVYTADPRKDKNARFIDKITWNEFIKIVGTSWDPGLNVPFDPIASKYAMEHNINVICADGKNIENTISILKNDSFVGTKIY